MTEGRKRQGFASMTPERRREIATRGGIEAHKAGTAHEFTSDEAKIAGRKGGLISAELRRKERESNESDN